MANWTFNPNEYEEKDYAPIPEGDHRVRIAEVVEKVFRNSGNEGFEITLDVSGYNSKLWYYLVLDPSDTKKTNQRIGTFFDSFGITDMNMAHSHGWVGKVGAVRVKHEEYQGDNKAKVAFCISKARQDKLPEAKFSGMAENSFSAIEISDDELPFN
jgi:hypothetical protein